MNERDIPNKILARGRTIAREQRLSIDYIDNDQREVNATVNGTYDYGVTVSASGENDYCECPYFPEHGYCKHIAAVLSLLKNQHRPLATLFSSVDRDDHFEEEFPDDFLTRSANFESTLRRHPSAAARIYPNKAQYNLLRSDSKQLTDFLANHPEPTPDSTSVLPNLSQLDPDIERYFARYQPQNRTSSGANFLAQLNLPDQQYFTPITENEVTSQPLDLAVTLTILPYSTDWSSIDLRAFISLHIADQVQHRFYKVANINQFLTIYQQEGNYQTGGKGLFHLSSSVFSEAQVQLLTLLINGSQPEPNRFQGSNNDRNASRLLASGDLARLAPLTEHLNNFDYESTNLRNYDRLKLTDYHAEDGLLTAHVSPSTTGYDFILTSQIDDTLTKDHLVTSGEQLFQLTGPQFERVSDFLDNYEETATFDTQADAGKLQFKTSEIDSLMRLTDYFKQIGTLDELPASIVQPHTTPHFDLSTDSTWLLLKLTFDYQGKLYAKSELDQVPAEQRQFEKERQTEIYLSSLGFTNQNGTWQKAFNTPEKLYQFFIRELPNLQINGVTTVSADLQSRLQSGSQVQSTIDVSEDNGLLSVNFSLSGIDEQDVDQVLQQLDVNRPYIARADGSIMLVDHDLKQLNQALIKLRHQGQLLHGRMQVNAAQALAVQAAVGDTAQFDASFKQLADDLAHPEHFDITDESAVQATLRPYQITGVKWFEMLNSHGFGGILADEMGLGKTLQMITFLNNHLDADHPDLVVSPASLIYNWLAEFHKFAPNVAVAVVDGNKAQRRQIINDTTNTVLITSYNSARRDVELYNQRGLNYLVLDEAQFVKNSTTKTHQQLRQLNRRNTFALSGTPIENRTEELWAIFALVMPGLLPNKTAFRKLTPDDITVRVKPFILRREKEAVLTDLPPKIETNLTNDMTPEQKTVYLAQLQQMQVKVRGMSATKFVKNRVEILAGLTRLRQICDTPALYMDDFTGTSGKLEQLIELLNQAAENNRHVLIFSQFTSMLSIIEEHLAQADLPAYVLKGDTKPKDRLAMVDAFNAGEKAIFLISLKAGGTGLNLTGADMVILVDLWWNPAVEDQATARAHRIGQHHQVDVYRLITQGTIEEQIYKLQEQKRDLVDQILSGTENKGALTEEEIRSILGIS
ncbi:Snf2 family protein [Secundilactobacillus odoratitofui DSM 19909 = JCM 15043]|uniref:Snf2 family protein n=1 Tax=Secundilactobacillus odoratitofui DSM 19909 = JCM 15043 TaxID=1423776 RepID=A0A0R1LSK7_9LACO|nr:DEAD/DEAH box helicase [Secundilactobacillus odoratitofui]KRK98464.1 Snf2 family protein [Secundilactobacillus odoratitofui DSM 19909 = JCM 15043]